MRFKYSLVIATLLLPAGRGFAASKEVQELQRDVAQLQDQVRTLQSGFDTKMAALQVLVQQALDAANKANTNVSVLGSGVNDTLDRALKDRLTPVAGVAAKVDNIGNDVSDVRNQMTDLTAQLNKLQSQISDINNAVKLCQSPSAAPPPPGAAGLTAPGGMAGAAGGPPPPAETVFNNAYRDETGGKLELALGEYNDFLKFYPQDPNAATAQFRIGEIYYTQGHMDDAVRAFDAVIERYPSGQSTADAYFMKGMALKQSNHKEAAATDFRALIGKFPSSPQAQQAKEQLRTMGYSVSASPARRKR